MRTSSTSLTFKICETMYIPAVHSHQEPKQKKQRTEVTGRLQGIAVELVSEFLDFPERRLLRIVHSVFRHQIDNGPFYRQIGGIIMLN